MYEELGSSPSSENNPILNTENSLNPKAALSVAELIQSQREVGALKMFLDDHRYIVYESLTRFLDRVEGEGFENAKITQVERLSDLRDRTKIVLEIAHDFANRLLALGDVECIEPTLRRDLCKQLVELSEDFKSVSKASYLIYSDIVKEWWSDKAKYGGHKPFIIKKSENTEERWLKSEERKFDASVDRLNALNAFREQKEAPLDLIFAARECLVDSMEWPVKASALEFIASCNQADIYYIFKAIDAALKEAESDMLVDKVYKTIKESKTDPSFLENYEQNQSKIDKLFSYPKIICEMPDDQAFTVSIMLNKGSRESWHEAVTEIRKKLYVPSLFAAQNGLDLEVSFTKEKFEISLAASGAALNELPPKKRDSYEGILIRTDKLEFPIKTSSPHGKTRSISTHVPRGVMASAKTFISFRDSLEAASDFISQSNKGWYSIHYNGTRWTEGNAEKTGLILSMHAYEESNFSGNDRYALDEKYLTFPWEEVEVKQSDVEFYYNENKQFHTHPPDGHDIDISGLALENSNISNCLVAISNQFERIRLELNLDNLILYDLDEQVEVLEKLLVQISEHISKREYPSNYGLLVREIFEPSRFSSGHGQAICLIEIFDENNGIVESGVFNATDLKLYLKDFKNDVERKAMNAFQDAINHYVDSRDIDACLNHAKIEVPKKLKKEIQRILKAYEVDSYERIMLGDPIEGLINVCRDPWYNVSSVQDKIIFQDLGHPPTPDISVIYAYYNVDGRKPSPIKIYRRALRFLDMQEANQGQYSIQPTEAFYERFNSADGNRLELK